MSPDDVVVVTNSWGALRPRRDALVDRLARSYRAVLGLQDAEQRARWLVDSVAELVGLLTAPSRLGHRARQLAATWPDSCSAPSFCLDGRAWMGAARDLGPSWTDHCERAWCQAWHLLSDVLAEESLLPFATPSRPRGSRSGAVGSPDEVPHGAVVGELVVEPEADARALPYGASASRSTQRLRMRRRFVESTLDDRPTFAGDVICDNHAEDLT